MDTSPTECVYDSHIFYFPKHWAKLSILGVPEEHTTFPQGRLNVLVPVLTAADTQASFPGKQTESQPVLRDAKLKEQNNVISPWKPSAGRFQPHPAPSRACILPENILFSRIQQIITALPLLSMQTALNH